MIKLRSCVFIAAAALSLAAACTSADKQNLSAAYESCKGREGDAFDRCIKGAKDRLDLERAEFDQRCQAEIDAQADRTAIRKGERTGDPDTQAWGDGCLR